MKSTLGPGRSAEVPAGTGEDWWYDSGEPARVVVEVTAAACSGPMAERFLELIESSFCLANSGHTNDGADPPLSGCRPS
ncbi:MAG: hypothetical protein ACHQCF_02885 [Solirubrobacterales bacterium]